MQDTVRRKVDKVLIQHQLSNSSTQSTTNSVERTILEIKNEDVYVMKADKGNKVVILDKSDYEQKMMRELTEGPYERISSDSSGYKSTLHEITNKTEKILKK